MTHIQSISAAAGFDGRTPRLHSSSPPIVRLASRRWRAVLCFGAIAAALIAPTETLAQTLAPRGTPTHPPPTRDAVAPRNVTVEFSSAVDGDRYTIRVISSGGLQVCTVPCALQFEPGPARVAVGGDATFEQTVLMDGRAMAIEISRFRPGSLGLGLILAAVGAGSVAFGGYAVGTTSDEYRARNAACRETDPHMITAACRELPNFGAPLSLIALGALSLGTSVYVFTHLGSNRLSERAIPRSELARRPQFAVAPIPGGGMVLFGRTF